MRLTRALTIAAVSAGLVMLSQAALSWAAGKAVTPAAAPAAVPPVDKAVPKPVPAQKPAALTPSAKPGAKDAGTKAKKPVVPAKELFGAAKMPAPLAARAIGSYAKGCLAGGEALPIDGPEWQVMRLVRNRNWGHPALIKLLERFAGEVKKHDGWNGLLVGDIAQPRGGPMLSGHASHQVGLDADVWLTPMPEQRFNLAQRESISATLMAAANGAAVDPKAWTPAHVKIIKRAASYREVERIFVHPAIKKALCEAAGTDRRWLHKVRPMWGHNYHFHIRIGCPKGSGGCSPQKPAPSDDGCGKEVADWIKLVTKPEPPQPLKPTKPSPVKPPITMAQLPAACGAVLKAPSEPATAAASGATTVTGATK